MAKIDTIARLTELIPDPSAIAAANLRARLQAFYGAAARLELSELEPHGVKAEIILEGVL